MNSRQLTEYIVLDISPTNIAVGKVILQLIRINRISSFCQTFKLHVLETLETTIQHLSAELISDIFSKLETQS